MHSSRHLCPFPEGCLVLSKKVIASFRETIPTEFIKYSFASLSSRNDKKKKKKEKKTLER